MAITAQTINQLRQETGCGLLDCKQALEESGGDMAKAVDILRKRGEKIAAKKVDRATGEGIVSSYIHPGAKVGVLIKLVCETDFVARTDAFQELAHDLAMQVAAMSPQYVRREDVPAAVLEKEKEVYHALLAPEKKPAEIIEQIMQGKIDKFYAEVCLLEQPFIKDDQRQVRDLLQAAITKLGENIQVKEFARLSVK